MKKGSSKPRCKRGHLRKGFSSGYLFCRICKSEHARLRYSKKNEEYLADQAEKSRIRARNAFIRIMDR